MPHRRLVFLDLDGEQALDDLEQAGDHLRFGEVLLHFLLGEGVACLHQLLGGVGGIPGLEVGQAEFVAGESLEFGNIFLGEGLGLLRHVAQEVEHLCRRVGHLGVQRDFGEVVETEHGRFLSLEFEDALDQRAVVPFRLRVAVVDFGGARRVGAVHAGAQLAVVGVLHQRAVGRRVQGEFPALDTRFFSGFAGGVPGVVRQAGEQAFVGDDLGEGVGRVEDVFRELGGDLRQLFHDRLEARFLVFRQFSAAEAEIADLVVDDLPAFGGERGVFRALLERPVLVEQLQVLAELGVEARNLRQHLVVGLAPGGHVVDRMQVADDTPGAAEPFQAFAQGAGEVGPGGGRAVGGQAVDQGAAIGQQLGDRRFDMFRLDQVEAGQVGEIEQGIGGCHGRRG